MSVIYNAEIANFLILQELLKNPYGRILNLDLETNEMITLRQGAKTIEFTGMVKGGKSKHIKTLVEGDEKYPELTGLKNDAEFLEHFGRPMRIAVFKPNSLMKILFDKHPVTRAAYNEAIIHGHGTLLSMLSMHIRGDIKVKTYEVDLAILDRGPIDDLIWTNALYDTDNISAEERDYHISMARNLGKYVRLAIGLNVPPKEAMKREGGKEGTVMNIPFLRILHAHYLLLAEEAKEGEGQPVTIQTPYEGIDGTEDFLSNAKKIYKRVRGLYIHNNLPEELSSRENLEDIVQ
jgi:hypothetical protein